MSAHPSTQSSLHWVQGELAQSLNRVRTLLEQTTKRGRVMLTGCSAGGRFLGRVCVLSFRTHQQHIDHLVDDLTASLSEVLPQAYRRKQLRTANR